MNLGPLYEVLSKVTPLPKNILKFIDFDKFVNYSLSPISYILIIDFLCEFMLLIHFNR